VTAITAETVLAVFLIFCRVGGCLLIMPGFSSSRVLPQVRLFVALAVSLALAPMLLDDVAARLGDGTPAAMLRLILMESLTGVLIGLLGRLFFMALQTMAVAVAQATGFAAMSGAALDDGEPLPAIASLITMTATTLLFLTDQHWELIRGLVESYATLPPGEGFGARLALVDITDQITAAFFLALRISSPFLIYSFIVNFAIGLTNKLTPAIPAYFILMPLVTTGGLVLLYFTIQEFLIQFIDGFGTWLAHG
jgi:flagellar biosynthetic protein FliR